MYSSLMSIYINVLNKWNSNELKSLVWNENINDEKFWFFYSSLNFLWYKSIENWMLKRKMLLDSYNFIIVCSVKSEFNYFFLVFRELNK